MIKKSEKKILLYEQFSFKTKYISILEKENDLDKGIQVIKNEITKKIQSKCPYPEDISFEFIVLFMDNFLNINLEYNDKNIDILRKIPLKFININFQNNYFSLDYGFPYIKTLIEETKNKINTENYFKNNLYIKVFYSQFKGIYFEEAVKRSILVRALPFGKYDDNKEFFKTKVNNFLSMEIVNNESNANTLIQQIKSNIINNYNSKKYIQYFNDSSKKISKEIHRIKKSITSEENLIKFYYEALNEELSKLSKEKEEYDNLIQKKSKDIPQKFVERNVDIFNKDFQEGKILIEQTQTNGKCLDAVVLLGDKDNKALLCLQMKFYSEDTQISSGIRNKMNKQSIKSTCKSILSNIYLKFDITVTSWHYILILYYNKDLNSYNRNFETICNNNELYFILYDPCLNKFYDSNKREIKQLHLNNLSNLEEDEMYSNPSICFVDPKYADTLLKKRKRELEKSKSLKKKINDDIKKFEKKYKVSFQKFFEKVKKANKIIKNLTIMSSINLDINNRLPFLNDGYGFVFLNKSNDDLVFEGKVEKMTIILHLMVKIIIIYNHLI